MKKPMFLLLSLFFACAVCGQDSLSVDSLSRPAESLPVSSESVGNETAVPLDVAKAKMEGDSAYVRSDYVTAIQIYERILQQGEASEVYYNLGNSYYKTGNIGKAILNYERALLLEPGNADVRANLEIARSKTVDKAIPASDIFFISWIKSLINTQSIDTWATCGIVFFFLLIASACLFLFAGQARWKKAAFFASIALLLLVVLTNVFAAYQKSNLVNRDNAVILSPSVVVRSTPSENGTSLFVLHEGHKVRIKDDSMREWKEIELEDGKVGWVQTAQVEVI